MTQSRFGKQEDQTTIPPELQELVQTIASLPDPYRTQLQGPLGRVVDNARRRRQILNLVQDALGELRLDMKYLLFDLDATRRERDEYRRKLEQSKENG